MSGTSTGAGAAPTLPVGTRFVTDGGLETDLIFHAGVDLPHFAAYPLLREPAGRALLTDYYDGYADVAARAGVGLLLETPTWRANPDWGARLGDDAAALDRVNRAAVEFVGALRERYAERYPGLGPVLLVGTTGPRGDGYRSDGEVDPDEAQAYHRGQVESFAVAGADLVTAYTLTEPGEAVGIVRAARAVGLPVATSFTVETDGRLACGTTLDDAVRAVDAQAAPDHHLVNCAHPTHVAAAFADGDDWTRRVGGVRVNASLLSHAELDEAETLDDGDPEQLAGDTARLLARLPHARVLGGCCGTDVRHVAALWGVAPPPRRGAVR